MESVIVGVIVLGAIGFIAWKKFGKAKKEDPAPQAPVAIQPVPQPIAPVVSPVAPISIPPIVSDPKPEPTVAPVAPTITDVLYQQSDEVKRILDERARLFREQQGSDGFGRLEAWPAVWEPRRFRCRMDAGVVYRTEAPAGRGWAVSVTTSGDYNARFGGAAGAGMFEESGGVIEAVTDANTEVWLDPR